MKPRDVQIPPAEKGFEILGWDSDTFGFPVARVLASDDTSVVANSLEDARRSGVRLAYLLTENVVAAGVAASEGGALISERITFARELTAGDADLTSRSHAALAVEKWTGNTPTRELLQLARDAGRYSRFRIDSKVPEGVFERIYDAWITNSLNGQIADEVLVTRDASSITGLVTVGAKDNRADIGLLAVREDARGRGLGTALVMAALSWGAARHFAQAQVVTQRANVGACRLYESCGYRVERCEQVFHFWL